MLKKVLRYGAISIAILALVAATLHQFFGLRLVILGGGTPSLAFVTPPARQAQNVERHRQAQAEAPLPEAPPDTTTPTPDVDAVTPAPVAQTPDWGFFRGPRWDGHYTARPITVDWPQRELTPVWKQPVGGGYASFVTARIGTRDVAFTIEQRGRQEVAAAYDVATGRELWTNRWDAEFKEFMGGDGPRATPTYADGLVHVQGAEGELRTIDAATGTLVWRTNILTDASATNIQWGMSTAPLVVDETVVVVPGGRDGRFIVAYDRKTGAKRWSSLSDKASYSSPMLVTIDNVRQIVVVSASRILGLSPADGSLYWEHPWVTMYDVNAGQPLILDEKRVFMSSGYDHGATVIEVSMTGSVGTVREVWKNNRMKNQFTSSVHLDGYIYGLDESILACVRASDGTPMWKGGRYGYGQIALASGYIIVLTEDGDMALVRATPDKHDEYTRFPVLDGKTWNHPAFSDGRLLVRNINQMAMFDLRR